METNQTEERDLIALYVLVRDNFLPLQGVCRSISELWYNDKITIEERDKLRKHWKKHHPNILSKFWWNKEYQAFNSFWWKLTSEGDEQRKLYIQYLIDKEVLKWCKKYLKSSSQSQIYIK